VEDELSLEGEIVRYPSVSLSTTLCRNEKVKQHIRKKTHKPNALRFWVKGGVIPLCDLLVVSSLGFSQQVALEPMVCDDDWIRRVQFDPYIKSLPDGGFRQSASR